MNALLAVKVHWPSAARVNAPYWPTTVIGVKVLSGLSTSVAVRVPPVTSGASVSVRVTLALLTTAASLLPVMVMVTVCSVPSTEVTTKVSTLVSPSPRYCTLLLSTW
ncbi:hypothetical protein D3C79_883240 [compost metagenome]